MEHCWHEKASYGHHGEQCCNCGIRWWDGMSIPLSGHGRFAPKEQELPRPNKPCLGANGIGKQGRAAIMDDVDFAALAEPLKAREV
jgi:hypothetical protein